MSKKKRKVRWDRILLVLLVPVLLIGICMYAFQSKEGKRSAEIAATTESEPSSSSDSKTGLPSTSESASETSSSSDPSSGDSDSVRITATGDILMEEAILNWFGTGDWKGYMDALVPYFSSDDLTIANQEVPIAGDAFGITGIDYSFNSPDITADNVKAQGIDFVTLANNHAMDRGQEGLNATIANLDRVGLDHTGAYESEEAAADPAIVEINGMKIGIASWTYATNIPAETAWSVDIFSGREEELLAQVRQLDENCDAVIVCMHWGTEFTYALNEAQTTLSSQIAEAGADVIIGNHPHTIQPATWLEGKNGKTLCFYSLGNLVSSAYQVDRADEQFQNMYEVGAVGQFSLQKQNDGTVVVTDPEIIPYVIQFSDEYQNFKIVKLSDYTEAMAEVHDQHRFSSLFTAEWLKEQVHQVFDPSGIKLDLDE